MASDDTNDEPDTPRCTSLPGPDLQTLGRSYLEKAFNHVLIPTPFALVSGFLEWFIALTYMWTNGPWLCYYLPLPCKIFRPFLRGLGLYPIFIILALCELDHLLSLSPVFRRPEAFAESPRVDPSQASQERSASTEDGQPSSSDMPVVQDENGKRRVRAVLLTLVIREVDWRRQREILWEARQAFSIANWKASCHRYRRTALERCIGYLLFSFGLAIASFEVFLLRSRLASNIHVYPDLNYCWLALLTSAFAYAFLLRYHSYRSAYVRPGSIASLLVSLGASILITLWVLHSLASVVSGFFCDHLSRTPLGPIPCAGSYPHKLLLWLLAGPLVVLQIYTLWRGVVTSWKARRGVSLELGADVEDRGRLPANLGPTS